jgi:hypothetical protein
MGMRPRRGQFASPARRMIIYAFDFPNQLETQIQHGSVVKYSQVLRPSRWAHRGIMHHFRVKDRSHVCGAR